MPQALKYTYKTQETKTAPKQNVAQGNFSSYENIKKSKIAKVNKVISMILSVAILVSMIGYSTVVAKENQISKFHKEISDLNYENIELENKLENVKSFYNVDDKISKTNLLDKPEKIIEVEKVDTQASTLAFNRNLKINSALGY
ncbi:MAG: hypothetical protein WC197_02765 [Candidatus Gastranaerophilaceae bacterium]|jgi:hypothetical protein